MRAAAGKPLWCGAIFVLALGCDDVANKLGRARSDAVASSSREMSGPSLLSAGALVPAISALRAQGVTHALRIELRPGELIMQAEDPKTPGSVLEFHYRDGKLSAPERATLRGKGELSDNLFDLDEVNLDAIPELAREAVKRVDPDSGSVDWLLVRRNLPESDDVRLRVYVASPLRSGSVDADRTGRLL